MTLYPDLGLFVDNSIGNNILALFLQKSSQLQGTHTAETLAGDFLVIWSKAHIFWGGNPRY